MPKAILELEMPGSCETCPIKRYLHYGWVEYICSITGEEIANKGRRSDCPLKPVERCEWILIDDDKGLWQCSKCGAEWVLEAGTPADNEMNYCPACGRRLEVEP